MVLKSVRLVGAKDDFNGIGEGFGFPVRFRMEAAQDPDFGREAITIADHTREDFANPGVTPVEFPVGDQAVRYLRVTATKLAPRQNDYIFALAELLAISTRGENVAAGSEVTALDSIEAPVRWQRANLVDGYYWGVADDSVSAPPLAHCKQNASR